MGSTLEQGFRIYQEGFGITEDDIVFITAIFRSSRNQLITGQIVLSTTEYSPFVIKELIPVPGSWGYKRWQGPCRIAGGRNDTIYPFLGEQYRSLQTLGLAPIQHKRNVFHARFKKSPSPACTNNRRFPTIWTVRGV